MHAMVQKKITIKREQEAFLAACREFGFADQSSLIRAALDDFIKETKRKQRRALITQKAGELAGLYGQNSDLTAFTAIDSDDFL
jgi:Arc/MetJ-type ribon-helix-helix transcriptional regulator